MRIDIMSDHGRGSLRAKRIAGNRAAFTPIASARLSPVLEIAVRATSMVLLALTAACSTDDMTHEGGGWYTTFTSGHTLGTTTLYRRDRAMPVRVDDNVFIRGFHPPDCLLYEPQRRSGVVYAVCGARTPVAVAAYAPWSQDRRYEADSSGLYMIDTVRVIDGRAVARVERVPIAEIRRIAESRPPFQSGWTTSEPDELAMRPIVSDELVDANAHGPRGTTPLIEAARRGQLDVTEALLRAGADVDAIDSSGMTALEMASRTWGGDTAIVRRLLDAGADRDVTDNTGFTPLMQAAIGIDTAMFQLLLDEGANPCLRDDRGRTIADIATPERPAMHRAATSAWARCNKS